jgi:hypothetical protein
MRHSWREKKKTDLIKAQKGSESFLVLFLFTSGTTFANEAHQAEIFQWKLQILEMIIGAENNAKK